MKRIIAFVKPNMLDDVIFALHETENFPGATISEVHDIGTGCDARIKKDDLAPFHEFPKSCRMEIVCATEQADVIVNLIQERAYTGLPDDGKIHVSNIDETICIRTGHRGSG